MNYIICNEARDTDLCFKFDYNTKMTHSVALHEDLLTIFNTLPTMDTLFHSYKDNGNNIYHKHSFVFMQLLSFSHGTLFMKPPTTKKHHNHKQQMKIKGTKTRNKTNKHLKTRLKMSSYSLLLHSEMVCIIHFV